MQNSATDHSLFPFDIPIPNAPAQLHHYCSMDTCFSILKNKELWLNSLTHMNDTTEGIHLDPIIRHCCQNHKTIKNHPRKDEIADMLVNLKNDIARKGEHAFIMCFSSRRNFLSQWRNYGDNGKGVSISFDVNTLNIREQFPIYPRATKEKGLLLMSLLPVLYSKGKQKKWIGKIVQEYVRVMKNEQTERSPLLSVYSLLQLGYISKHPAFQYENEFRIIHQCECNNNTLISLFGDIHYRNSKYGCTPYIKLPICPTKGFMKKFPIIKITLGPDNPTCVENFQNMLTSMGFNIKVLRSHIPYRN